MRRKITHETWEQIKTGYAAGINLREIARKMAIPEGTVLAHAKRHGWTQQIQVATRHLDVVQSDAIAPVQPVSAVQPVPQSIAEILSERKTRSKLALSRFTAEASEQAAEHPDKLAITRKAKDLSDIHGTLWPDQPGAREEIVNLAIVTRAWEPRKYKPEYDSLIDRDRPPMLRLKDAQVKEIPPNDCPPAPEHGPVEDPAERNRIAARASFERKCRYWRSEC
jgi:hypothetical protein